MAIASFCGTETWTGLAESCLSLFILLRNLYMSVYRSGAFGVYSALALTFMVIFVVVEEGRLNSAREAQARAGNNEGLGV